MTECTYNFALKFHAIAERTGPKIFGGSEGATILPRAPGRIEIAQNYATDEADLRVERYTEEEMTRFLLGWK